VSAFLHKGGESLELEQVLMNVAMTTINYIFVNSITSASQQAVVSDMKTDMRMMKDDLMNQIKDAGDRGLRTTETAQHELMSQLKEQHVNDDNSYAEIINQIKETEQSMTNQHLAMIDTLKGSMSGQGQKSEGGSGTVIIKK